MPVIGGLVNAKRYLLIVFACTAVMLLSPNGAAAQGRGGGGGGGRGGGGGGQPAAGHSGGGARPSPGHGPSGNQAVYRSNYYRPYYSHYRPYYSYYRPYYSPYWYNGFYASFYYGLGYSPFYASFAYGGYPYGYGYGYGYGGPYGYPYYGYSSWSSARIEVKPREAQVFVDGYYVGIADQFDGVFQRLDMQPGGHEIAIYLPGYRTYHERIYFQPGNSLHLKANLEPLPPGTAPEPKPEPSPNAPDPNRGGYARDPQQGGYGRDPQQGGYGGDPQQGGNEPYGPPPARPRTQPPGNGGGRIETGGFGTLNLRVQPGDAVVQIDGERWDSSEGGSRLVVQLAVGRHRVEVHKDGFRPYSATIDIRPGEPQTLNISLPQQN